MKKIDQTVMRETLYISVITIILSILMQSIFLVAGQWNYTVLLGNLLGIIAAVGNFFLMGLTVQTALGKEDKAARSHMKLSQRLRMLMLFAAAIIGYLVPVFDIIAVIIPFIFPRIAVSLRPLFMKNDDKE